ncbi:MAG: hypothetical protein HQ500_04480 [Flavobacteriales bacterium]|nr:hypothetical protein [Flavobacteriales bacterium]
MLNSALNIRSSFIWVLTLSLALVQYFFLSDESWSIAGLEVITGDGRGYYDYLTSIFIDGDLTHQQINGRYILSVDGVGVNKYYAGTALLMLPFFLLGMFIAWLTGVPVDGFSLPFQLSMCLAALTYAMGGVYFFRRLLASFDVKVWAINVLSFAAFFATNMLYYTAYDLTASHVYSFFAIAAFAWYARQYFLAHEAIDLLNLAFWFGITLLIRPVNALVIFALPFLAGDRSTFLHTVRALFKNVGALVTAAMVIVGLGLIQLMLYKLQSGNWIVWSYAGEGFYFHRPAFFAFLFGFKRGWLIYSPFFLLLIPALWKMMKSSRWMSISWISYLLLSVYGLSAWWSWHYGGSYGARPMVDLYAILLLPIGIWLNKNGSQIRQRIIVIVVAVFSLLTAAQVHQMKHGILSAWHMNAGKYFWAFGKYDADKHAHQLGGRDDTMPYHKRSKTLYAGTPKDRDGHWKARHAQGEADAVFTPELEFSLGYSYVFGTLAGERIFIELEVESQEYIAGSATGAFLVIELKAVDGKTKRYDAFRINEHPGLSLDHWHSMHYAYSIEEDVKTDDQFKMYIWNKEKGAFALKVKACRILALE